MDLAETPPGAVTPVGTGDQTGDMAEQQSADRGAWCEVLATARLNAGLNVAEVARAAGVSHKTVSNIESGATPHHTTLARVRTALGLPEDLELARRVAAAAATPQAEPSLMDQVRVLEKRVARLEQSLLMAAHAYRGMTVALPELGGEPD